MKQVLTIFWILLLPLILLAQNDLFFSEYVEGSSYNKAIEIYNPTNQPVSLDNYLLRGTANGATDWEFDYNFPAGATLPANGTYVFCDGQASAEIKSRADWVVDGYECGYNGNDSRGLFKKNGASYDLLDVIGNPVNPNGDDYSVAGIASGLLDHTLIRKASVSHGNPDWLSSAGTNATDSEWIVKNKDDITDLGMHTFEGGGVISGDGQGTVSVVPTEVPTDSTLDLTFTCAGADTFVLTTVQLVVPPEWSWSNSTSDVVLSGNAYSGAQVTLVGDTVEISAANLTSAEGGTIVLKSVTSPASGGLFPFTVRTATATGSPANIAASPVIQVVAPAALVSIADIQNNFASYDGQPVIIEAVVTIGVNVTRTDRTDAYVQDESGRGINLSDASVDYPLLVRGNKLRINGTVGDYNGTTQLSSFSMELISENNPIPGLAVVSTQEAGNVELEGTMIQTAGVINDKAEGIGGGTNITINDGSGDIQMRIWDSSGLDLSAFSVGDTMGVRGIIDTYNSAAQLLVGYQDDVFKASFVGSADGKGTVTVTPQEVEAGLATQLQFALQLGAKDTLGSLELTIPSEWVWTPQNGSVQLSAEFGSATPQISGQVITVNGIELTNSGTPTITVNDLTAPAQDTISTFAVRTAGINGSLTAIGVAPTVIVGAGTGIVYIPMEQARSQPVGSVVTVRGVVSIGSGLLSSTLTSAYLQSPDGYGINIFRYGSIDPDITRGNEVIMHGTLDSYSGVLELTDYTTTILRRNQEIPAIRQLFTSEAAQTTYEGSFCEIQGTISGTSSGGGGTNLYIDDGSGEVTVRVWDATGVDLSGYSSGDFVTVRGALGIYNNAGQILLAYPEDIFKSTPQENADGHGEITVSPDEVAKGDLLNLSFTVAVQGSDSLAELEMKLPGNWDWSGNSDDLSLGGAFETAKIQVDSQHVALMDFLLTADNPGSIELRNLTAATTDTSSKFEFRTASPGGRLRSALQSPVILVGAGTSVPFITIKEARQKPADSTVTVAATVVIGANVLRSTTVSGYVADSSGRGINIYSQSADPTLKRANLNLIRGTLTTYVGSQGDTTLEITNYTSRILKTNATLPKAVPFTPTGASKAPTAFEGSWVEVEGRINSMESDLYGINLLVGDNFAEIIVRINNDTGIDVSGFKKNDYVNVKGVVGFYRGDFQVQPGYQEDIYTFEPQDRPQYNQVKLILPAKPFVPERGEHLTVDYQINNLDSHITIRIFDLGGRLVTTLFDGPPYNEEINWNGRNTIDELVPVGTYICHLEVVDNNSGKHQVKIAPIVVGTVLR